MTIWRVDMRIRTNRRHRERAHLLALALVALALPAAAAQETPRPQPKPRSQPQSQAQPRDQPRSDPQPQSRQRLWRENTVVKIDAGPWTGARLADGQPDVQGHWSNTIGNHNNLTDPQGPLGADDEAPPSEGGRPRRVRPRSERAPSRVSDPPDGEVPFQPWARAKQQELLAHLNNPIKEEYVEPLARCAPGGPTKSFMWHGYEIRQYPGHVLFLFDSGTRVIYLENQQHLPETIKLWNADSRGHWEGNTLVVDVANNNAKARLGRSGEFTSDKVHIVERYIFANDGSRFTYEAEYTDLTVLTRPFTITIPNRRITPETPEDDWNNLTFRANHDGPEPILEVYERICVEGNGEHGKIVAGPTAGSK